MHQHLIPRSRQGIRQSIVSILVNACLFALKFWAGMVSGSVALIADAWHTLSDSLTSLILIIGLSLSKDEEKQGRNRRIHLWEHITTLVIGAILIFVAIDFLIDAIERIREHEQAHYGTLAMVVVSISLLAKEGLALYARRIYRNTDIVALRAISWHSHSDAISSLLVLIGIFFGRTYWWIDGVLGIIVSALLLWVSLSVIRYAIQHLRKGSHETQK